MSTLGKWWGRRPVTTTKCGWRPAGAIVAGPPILLPDGRVLFQYSQGGNVIFRLAYSTVNFAQTPRGDTKQSYFLGAFYFDGYIYALGTAGAHRIDLYKINTTTAVVTRIETIMSGLGDTIGGLYSYLAFDGSDFIGIGISLPAEGSQASWIFSYEISTDTLYTHTSTGGTVAYLTGIGISGTTLYFSWNFASTYYLRSVTLGGGSGSTLITSSASGIWTGWKGFHLVGSVIYNAARDSNFTLTGISGSPVFILDDEADWKMLYIGSGVYKEQEGATLLRSVSFGGTTEEVGIYPFRSDEAVDYSTGQIKFGGPSSWNEFASNSRESA